MVSPQSVLPRIASADILLLIKTALKVEQCLELYQHALRLHQKGRVEDAKQLYRQLIESEVMQEEVLVGVSIFLATRNKWSE